MVTMVSPLEKRLVSRAPTLPVSLHRPLASGYPMQKDKDSRLVGDWSDLPGRNKISQHGVAVP